MKPIFVLLFLSLCASSPAVAQNNNYPYSVGIKGGISIPNLSSSKDDQNVWNKDYTSRLGPYFGVQFEWQLARHFSLQAELDYVGEGGKRNGIQPMTVPAEYLQAFQQAFNTTNDYLFADLKNVSRINFLQLPILAKYHLPLTYDGRLQVYIQAGPFAGLMVASKQIVKTDDLKVYLDEDGHLQIPQQLSAAFFGTAIDTVIEAKNDLHKFNFGIQGAVGFSYSIGRSKIFIEGGGNYGFLPLQKGDEHGKDHIGAGTLIAGYAFGLGKNKTAPIPAATP